MSKEGFFHNRSTKHLLVIGDLMLDEYVQGAVHRKSPEAPVDVLLTSSIYHKVGGAANVARNIQQLGCKTTLIGLVGSDRAGEQLSEELQGARLQAELVVDSARPTTVKRRYLADTTHLLRVDTEDTAPVSAATCRQVLTLVSDVLQAGAVTGLVLSDYNKGLLSPPLIHELLDIAKARNIAVYVDPKHDHFWLYQEVAIMKPNKKELLAAVAQGQEKVNRELMEAARTKLRAEMLVCTLAADGVAGIDATQMIEEETEQIAVVDVSGAGDSVLAAIALGHQCGHGLAELLTIANAAGRLACLQSGVAVITLDMLKKEVSSL